MTERALRATTSRSELMRQAGARRRARIRKRHERARLSLKALRELTRAQSQRCVDFEALRKNVREEAGCWIWLGPYKAVFQYVKPIVYAGQYGRMWADRAIFHAVSGRPIRKRCFAKTTCGNPYCISPEHVYESNPMVERARKNLRVHSQTDGVLTNGEGGGDDSQL